MLLIFFSTGNINFTKVLVMSNKFKEWHISLIEKVQKITGISNYQIVWLSFIEGLIIGLIIGYLL